MKQLVITYIRKNAVVKGKPNMPCHILPLVLPAFPGMLELIGDGFISSVSKCSQWCVIPFGIANHSKNNNPRKRTVDPTGANWNQQREGLLETKSRGHAQRNGILTERLSWSIILMATFLYHCEVNPIERCWFQAKRYTRAYCNYWQAKHLWRSWPCHHRKHTKLLQTCQRLRKTPYVALSAGWPWVEGAYMANAI